MKKTSMFRGLGALCVLTLLAVQAEAATYLTTADNEFRESQPTTNRGDNGELASRVSSSPDGSSGRASAFFMKFDVSNMSANELANAIIVQTTYGNDNLFANRIQDLHDMPPALNTGFDYFVLDPTVDGADWDEMALTPLGAGGLGINVDGDFHTKLIDPDGNDQLMYLGTQRFDSADLQGANPHLLVGTPFELIALPGSVLHQKITAAQQTGHQTVTVAMQIDHNFENPNNGWLNHNYIMNSKERDPLDGDPDSPFGGAANDPQFWPKLITVPEPASLMLFGLGCAALLVARRK